ncbi:Biorientation of chromosomes in cell division protein 1 [Halotydeus destructor]|nr:Biorientation of chromosomes in cell division protein 1 [Halotydeus destructor]
MDSKTNKPEGIEYGTDEEVKDAVVQYLKSKGIFDKMRRECLSDIDTKPSFSNLNERIEGYVNRFLSRQHWTTSTNKIQLRERLRRDLTESGMMRHGVDHLIDSAIQSKSNSVFYPKIEEVVIDFLGVNEINETPEETKEEEPMTSETAAIKSELSQEAENHVDHQEVDMDVDSNSIENSTEANFIQTFTEIRAPEMSPGYVPKSILSENSTDAQMPGAMSSFAGILKNSNPFAMKIDSNSSAVKHFASEDKSKSNEPPVEAAVAKEEPEEVPPVKTEVEKPVETIVHQDRAEPEKEAEVVKPRTVVNIKTEPMETKTNADALNVEPETESGVKDLLSDVSSVHTSDLSDFDDKISISSLEEMEEEKKKDDVNVTQSDANESTTRTRRERKLNPKYASEEFASVFNKKPRGKKAGSTDASRQDKKRQTK